MISLERVAQRVYVTGDSYAIRDRLKAAGCHWDPERRQWWIGAAKASAVEAIVGGLRSGQTQPAPSRDDADPEVIGKARYKGRDYYVRWVGETKSGDYKARLVTLDAKIDFWAGCARPGARPVGDEAQVIKTYQETRRLSGLRRFVEEQRRDEAAAKAAPAKAAETPDQVLARVGRTATGPAKQYTRSLGRNKIGDGLPELGELLASAKSGPSIVVAIEQPYRVTGDAIEDNDAWSQYPDGPGWYVHYRAVPVEPTEREQTAAPAAAEKTASLKALREAIDKAGKYREPAACLPESDRPKSGLTVALTWRSTSSSASGDDGHVCVAGDVIGYHRAVYDDSPVSRAFADAELAETIRAAAARVRAAWGDATPAVRDDRSIRECRITEG